MKTPTKIRYLYVLEMLSTKACTRRMILNAVWNYPDYLREFRGGNVQTRKYLDWAVSDLSQRGIISQNTGQKYYQVFSLKPLYDALEEILECACEIYADPMTGQVIEIIFDDNVGLSCLTINRILKRLGKSIYDFNTISLVY